MSRAGRSFIFAGWVCLLPEYAAANPPGPAGFQANTEWQRPVFGRGIGATGLHIVDLDGDGTNEIVAGASHDGFYPHRFWEILRFDSGSYTHAWASDPYVPDIWSIRVANIDGNVSQDICVGFWSGVLVYDGVTHALIKFLDTAVSSIRGLTVVDVDSDGSLEFVFCSATTLYVYDVASGALEYSGSFGGQDLAVGNVDNDSAKEIVIANGSAPGYVLNGVTHAVEWNYAPGFGTHLALADLDGDGRDEIVAGYDSSQITAFNAELHASAFTIPSIGAALQALKVGDVDGNGSLDIVRGTAGGVVGIYNGQNGAPQWSVTAPATTVTDVAVGDTDGDGIPDLAVGAGYSTTGGNYLVIYDTLTHNIKWQSADVSGPFYAFDYGDVDNDGQPELIYGGFTSDGGTGNAPFYIVDAHSHALEYQGPPPGANGDQLWRIRHANVDADPQTEIFVTTRSGSVGTLRCYDGLTHIQQWQKSLPAGLTYYSMEVADVDADGQLDVVAGVGRENAAAPDARFYVYNAQSGVEEWNSGPSGGALSPFSLLRVANIDADPALEILGSQFGGPVLGYDGATHQLQLVAGSLVTALTAADFDGDGLSEVIIGTAGGLIQLVHPNGAVTPIIASLGGEINGLAVTDFTGDGVKDLAFALYDHLYVRDGASPSTVLFSSDMIGLLVGYGDSLTAGDFDSDGRPEIAVNLGLHGLRIYEFIAGACIVAANPPLHNPYVGSAVQPFRDVLQNTTRTLVPQGIGAPGTPAEGSVEYSTISVTFSVPPVPAPALPYIQVACTGALPAACPTVTNVSGSGTQYQLTLSGVIPAAACTSITFAGAGPGQNLRYQSLPGDVNMTGGSDTIDLVELVTALGNGQANLPANLARYNVDRSHEPGNPVNTVDLLRLVQLLNGINSTQVF
ncbi:MAG TPA: VCBS repeat-containing protein, partial [Phycisphaerae bacterium]